ncbi:MAG TPA: creatininase family protein [Xanthobacteraceae bacterium]|nr:creatininase family protein [Xanthobacteraceae bacterium]
MPEARPQAHRAIGALTFQDIGALLRADSVLCLPMGSMEQHGPHLPLNTDTVLAEALTGRIVERWGETYDLWRLPPLAVGLSREHAWAPGTLSLSVGGMAAYLRELAREIARSLPARRLLIVNGHGGNRGMLEAIGRELQDDFGLTLCALHLGAIISPVPEAGLPEIHAGKDETSVMLALAPELVRRERIEAAAKRDHDAAVRALILDPAASWPWSSDDQRLAGAGVIGDATSASAEHGRMLIERVVETAGTVLRQLREGGRT